MFSKLNGSMTEEGYPKVLSFFHNILSADEKEQQFLEVFMVQVFDLATRGDAQLCMLCAKLVAELRKSLPFLGDWMMRAFREYSLVLDEAAPPRRPAPAQRPSSTPAACTGRGTVVSWQP